MQQSPPCVDDDAATLLEDPAFQRWGWAAREARAGGRVRRRGVQLLVSALMGAACVGAVAVVVLRRGAGIPTAGSPSTALGLRTFEMAGCICTWIMQDNCQNSDPCACFCRKTHPQGPCTACNPMSHLKGVTTVDAAALQFGNVKETVWPTSETPFVGVNLGGWLVLEDWMWAAEMTAKGVPDEWTLVKKQGGPRSARAVSTISTHWDSFVTEADLDRLRGFGVSHVRIPIGFWLVDYDPADGFVDGGKYYLTRVLSWLRMRGMRALLDLHALPCAQAVDQSFTGRRSKIPSFFDSPACYARGKRAMRKLAELIAAYEEDAQTSGVVIGMCPINEPDWSFWEASPGIKELYSTVIPELRRILPARRYALHIFFWDVPDAGGAKWLASMQRRDPENFSNVVYDLHMYHSYGDDDAPGNRWTPDVDSCKTCCRDPLILDQVARENVSMAIGEYSLNTGFPGDQIFWKEYFRLQLSLWHNTRGMVGSFFWNHRIILGSNGYFREMSLLHLIAPEGPLPSVPEFDLSQLCPGYDLSKCPAYSPRFVGRKDACTWQE